MVFTKENVREDEYLSNYLQEAEKEAKIKRDNELFYYMKKVEENNKSKKFVQELKDFMWTLRKKEGALDKYFLDRVLVKKDIEAGVFEKFSIYHTTMYRYLELVVVVELSRALIMIINKLVQEKKMDDGGQMNQAQTMMDLHQIFVGRDPIYYPIFGYEDTGLSDMMMDWALRLIPNSKYAKNVQELAIPKLNLTRFFDADSVKTLNNFSENIYQFTEEDLPVIQTILDHNKEIIFPVKE